MEKRQNYKKLFLAILHLIIIGYGIAALYLYYRQTQWVDGAVYESDLPAHIRMIIVDGWYYSLTAFLYRLFYFLPFGDLAIAVFLAVCTLLSVYLTGALIIQIYRKVIRRDNTGNDNCVMCALKNPGILAASLMLNLVMGCYVKGMADGRYIGMEAPSIWHNSTYLVMKPAAILCLILYLDLEQRYKNRSVSADDDIPEGKGGPSMLEEKRSLRNKHLIFTLALAVCTGIKPSFLLAFAPMMALMLLWDLFHKVPFGKIFCFGLTVIPSLGVILLQNAVLFGNDTGNGWTFAPGYAVSLHSGHPLIAAGLSILFPILIGLLVIRKLVLPDAVGSRYSAAALRGMVMTILLSLVGFAQLFLFSETGSRAGDGNFMWGYSFTLLPLFTVAFIIWKEELRGLMLNASEMVRSGDRTKKSALRLRLCYLLVTLIVLIYHVYCGLYFFRNLVSGVSYWMWD